MKAELSLPGRSGFIRGDVTNSSFERFLPNKKNVLTCVSEFWINIAFYFKLEQNKFKKTLLPQKWSQRAKGQYRQTSLYAVFLSYI